MKYARVMTALLAAGSVLMLGSFFAASDAIGQSAGPVAAPPVVSAPPANGSPLSNGTPKGVANGNGHANGNGNGNGSAIEIPELSVNGGDEEEGVEVVNLDLVDAELAEVVNLFMKVTKKNIILGTNLPPGRVTLHLSQVEWRNALNTILEQRGFTLEDKMGTGVYTVTTKSAVDPLVTETIFLKYADVPSVKAVLVTALMDRGKIAEFPSRSAMIVTTTQQNLTDLKKIIEQIDIPRKQVYIEAKFMELKDSAMRNLGIDWTMLKAYQLGGSVKLMEQNESITRSSSRDTTLGNDATKDNSASQAGIYNLNGNTITYSEGRKPSLSLTDNETKKFDASDVVADSTTRSFSDLRGAVLSPLTFNMVLSALRYQDGISILSNPKIMVSNGEQAEIHVGEVRRIFNSSVTAPTASSGPIVSYTPGDSVDIGVKLRVTPTVHTDSNITVRIEPELSRYAGEVTAPNGQTYPIKSTKTVKTQFYLEDGKTAAIGGLTETQDTKVQKGVPLLENIPLLGKYLFSYDTDERVQQETIIFVTVGMANPNDIEKDTGLPSDTKFAREELIRERERNAQFENELAKMEDASKKRTEKADKRQRLLLNRSR